MRSPGPRRPRLGRGSGGTDRVRVRHRRDPGRRDALRPGGPGRLPLLPSGRRDRGIGSPDRGLGRGGLRRVRGDGPDPVPPRLRGPVPPAAPGGGADRAAGRRRPGPAPDGAPERDGPHRPPLRRRRSERIHGRDPTGRRDRRAGRRLREDGRGPAPSGGAAPGPHRQRLPRPEDPPHHHRRVHRRHPGRHDPPGGRADVPPDHLRREPPSEPSGPPDAGREPDPVRGSPAERGELRSLRAYAPGPALPGGAHHRPGPGRAGRHPRGGRPGAGGRGPDDAGDLQPPGQRRQVRPGGIRDLRERTAGGGSGPGDGAGRGGDDPAGGAAPSLRPFPQGRPLPQ